MDVRIQDLLDAEQCYDRLRELRWPEGRQCSHCDSQRVIRRGYHDSEPARRRYQCRGCERRFDDLTGTIFAGRHQPLTIWMLVLYFMGLNLSNVQIAEELDLHPDDVQKMTTELREGIVQKKRR